MMSRDSGIIGNLGEKQLLRSLIPERKLRLTRAFEISKNLIVMLMCAAGLDAMPFPHLIGRIGRPGIAPPPDFAALPVGAEDDVGISVAVDVGDRAAGFNREKLLLDHITIPAVLFIGPIPDQGRGFLTEGNDKAVDSILGQVGDDAAGLLRRFAGDRDVSMPAAEVNPFQSGGMNRAEVGRAIGVFRWRHCHQGEPRSCQSEQRRSSRICLSFTVDGFPDSARTC